MEQFVAKDASSESIETIAQFVTIIGVDSTFIFAILLRLRTSQLELNRYAEKSHPVHKQSV